MENLQVSDNETITSPKKGRGQYERKARGSYQKHKLEKKITVKHYLNKKINHIVNRSRIKDVLHNEELKLSSFEQTPFEFYDSLEYGLYVQITFNGQTTLIKSVTGLYLSEEDFANSESKYFYKDLCREVEFIKFHFQNLYESYSSRTIGLLDGEGEVPEFSKKEVQNKIQYNFLNKYSYYDSEINITVNSLLRYEVIENARKILNEEIEKKQVRSKEEEDRLQVINEEIYALWHNFYHSTIKYNFNVLDLLNYLEFRSPIFKDLRYIYTSEVWSFGAYYGFLRHDADYPYNCLGATILDFIEGDFENVFLSKFDSSKEVAVKIIEDLKSLVKIYYKK